MRLRSITTGKMCQWHILSVHRNPGTKAMYPVFRDLVIHMIGSQGYGGPYITSIMVPLLQTSVSKFTMEVASSIWSR